MRALTGIAVLLLGLHPGYAVDVTTCGQTVVKGDVGVVVADLSCGAQTAVNLEHNASLDLNGFTVAASDDAIECARNCAVTGPGTVAGDVKGSKKIGLADLEIDGGGVDGSISSVKLEATDVVIRNFGLGSGTPHAIVARKLFVDNVTVEDGGSGAFPAVVAEKIKGSDLTVRNTTTIGISAGRSLRVSNLTATGNAGFGVVVEGTARIDGGDVSENGQGVAARVVKAESLTATGNDWYGVSAEKRIRLIDSTVTGNDVAASGKDVYSGSKPRLVNTICGMSDGPDGSWGVCSGD